MVEPSVEVDVPFTQSVHADWFTAVPILPGGHKVALKLPIGQKLPIAQPLQKVEPGTAWCWPAGQSVHSVAFFSEYFPCGQIIWVTVFGQKWPSWQTLHDNWPFTI
jgi:hypothetical protein